MNPSSLSDRHGDQSTTWKLLLDFPCQFTDDENVTAFLPTISPTRDAILDSIRELSSAGGSGLIYYAGHCENRPDGISYLIPSDAQRLYGENPNLKYTFVLDVELGYTYDETGMQDRNSRTAPLRSEQAQLVVVSAAQRGETAGTITITGRESTPTSHGYLTYYLLRCLSKNARRRKAKDKGGSIFLLHQGDPM
ncbi:hypothetical protein M407DRAFT_214918 [Tulasnella calospora MUT 4182]|uniref:Uncharacterized protein n=1 Tax=Tulasnella calospora MUT 4182 TaxID=1051891 RepID=A0A0C3Q3G3_9AGAM|nr:hypothetical protein M407DRAFT_214918 [Tulasnella calospora MUT 4182]